MYSDEAKRFGRRVELRQDWDEVKVEVMRKIVREKFRQNLHLAKRLVETDNKELKEGNYWHDHFWGVDHKTGEGENHLGKILMELRESYQKNGLPENDGKSLVKIYGPVDGISIADEDITLLPVDCVVNAADKTLLGGTGVDGVIHREAGSGLLEECRGLGGCKTGQAKITGGYNLNAKFVIHTVGPVYGKEDESLLERCYRSCLDLTLEYEITSIAFPALSTGKFCFPKKKAMEIAIKTVRNWMKEHQEKKLEVIFACIDPRIYQYGCEFLDQE